MLFNITSYCIHNIIGLSITEDVWTPSCHRNLPKFFAANRFNSKWSIKLICRCDIKTFIYDSYLTHLEIIMKKLVSEYVHRLFYSEKRLK